jgi:uncharacterized membrane protein
MSALSAGGASRAPTRGLGWFPWVLLAGIALLLFLVATSAVGWLPHPGPNGPYPVVWPLFPFGFFLLFALLFLLFRTGRWDSGPWGNCYRPEADSAQGILRQRYARGEISAEELRRMMRELDLPSQPG